MLLWPPLAHRCEHSGAGLGDRFLRHVERTKLLLHLVDVSSASGRETVSDYVTVNHELRAYNPALAERPQIVVATKIDALEDTERLDSLRKQAEADGRTFLAISAVANKGIRELIFAVAAKLDEINESQKKADTIELSL